MTPITEIVIPFASLAGLAALIWGAATMVSGSKAVDKTLTAKTKSLDASQAKHEGECVDERKANRDAITALDKRVVVLETIEAGKK